MLHAVNILRLLGFNDFMKLYSNEHVSQQYLINTDINQTISVPVDPNLLKLYIDINWEEISIITKLSRDKSDNYIYKATEKILDKSFGMLLLSLKTFKKVHGRIVLTSMDSRKILPNNFSRVNVINAFTQNVLNTINAPHQRALVLNVIKENKVI